jgi:alanine-glyoxylate transaminase/serine-glyoxylate transaminase/serine-pyruvate transaminase
MVPAPLVTIVSFVGGGHVIDAAFRRYNLALGAGLSKVSGKLFRIGHLGDLNDLMVLGALAGAEMAKEKSPLSDLPFFIHPRVHA